MEPIQDRWRTTAGTRPCGGAEALGADAVALAEAYSPARFQGRAGASGMSAFVAVDLRLGWDLGLEAQERLSVEKPHLLIFCPVCLAFSQMQATQHKAGQNGGAAEAWQASLGVWCTAGLDGMSSEVDAFSLNALGRRRRGMSRA